ncbi:hypothetical protein ACPCBX_23175 [Streptomyces tuirus]|uniref:Uncharacterized protein n=1 Tax=Streptomyces tuirus TaxID=68278 RepID=A0A7G1NIW8_9ACTN|nr:hypothetical protein [Streptomyces tuirus]BCL22182.1 hypothetical protein GCM10017668_40250 [Streptomyces tuirus]
MDGTTAIRLGLRHFRTSLAEKTKLQDSAAGRETFSAALQQFEEQMKAAEVVSPATRPINLYYGLVQMDIPGHKSVVEIPRRMMQFFLEVKKDDEDTDV